MIKTHSGEMIEPRVGDIVEGRIGDDTVWGVITKVDKDFFTYEREDDFIPIKGSVTGPYREGFCLIHRPFHAGDEVELVQTALGVIEDVYDNGIPRCIATNNIFVSRQVRHKNPAWRDHPDYKEEE